MSRAADMPDFPWTYDQFQRYHVLQEFLSIFYPGNAITVLDVGGLSPDRIGRSFWLPIKRVAPGPTTTLDVVPWDEPGYIRGDGRSLPFEDGSFDVVSALDVLEHVPPEDRERFLIETARVSKNAVFLSAPFRSSEIETTEDLLETQIEKLYGTVQHQLQEQRDSAYPNRNMSAGRWAVSSPRARTFPTARSGPGFPTRLSRTASCCGGTPEPSRR
jgi:SAM-dependent methyltransferase